MPIDGMQDERPFWNPYRWVPASKKPLQRERPLYHHRWQGVAGRLHCTLEALTPFLIKDQEGAFIRSKRTQAPFIPATSLKGAIRSLAELIGNAAVPFPRVTIDVAHQLEKAAQGQGPQRQLDPVARTFGHLNHGDVFAGLIRFGDGQPLGKLPQPLSCKVAVGQPKPAHRPFYPGDQYRKLYHHHFGATSLTPPHAGITQTNLVRPLPPGVQFTFRVDFANLRDEELALLLYCLTLEEDVTVTLSAAAVGGTAAMTLRGPLRHKMGHCKPHGGGSVHIRVDKMELRANPAQRYRGESTTGSLLEGEALTTEVESRTRLLREENDLTMQHLRAMLIYTKDDPRAKNVNYPTYQWFQDDKRALPDQKAPLKPTI